MNPLDRLKVLINSSTPIVVMETVEEMCAMSLVRTACSQLSLPVYEWTIADGLVRCGSDFAVAAPVLSATGSGAGVAPRTAMYNTADPVQALANLETMTIEAVFVLKDFHRHMDNPVVVRRLRDVGQKFSANWSAWWNSSTCPYPIATGCARLSVKPTREWPVPTP